MGNISFATRLSTTSVPETTFRLEIPNISTLKGATWSPKVVVRGTSWKFKILKTISAGKEQLIIYLYCVEKDVLKNWWQQVCATVKLLSFNHNVKPIENCIKSYIFESSSLHKCIKVIYWDELFDKSKDYVRDDVIMLEFKIEAYIPNFKESNIEQIGSSHLFRVTIKSIDNMMAIHSSPFKLLGARLCLSGFKSNFNQIGVCLKPLGKSKKFPIDITMSLKLLGTESREKSETKRMTSKNQFIVYFEEEWLKLAKAQKRPTIIEITLNAKKPNDAVSYT